MYLVGIDLGTTGTKASICDEAGNLVADAFEPSNLIHPEPGAVEQDPEEMLASVLKVIREALQKSGVSPSKIAAVGMDGQMAGTMGIGAGGEALTPYDSWLDTRCGKHRERILALGEEHVISLTGAPVTYAHGPKVVWWQQEHPQVFKNIKKFIMPSAYCVMRMCGLSAEEAFIDHTYLHFTGFADTANKAWSKELLIALGVPEDKMPRIVRPDEVVGFITPEMAEKCLLPSGTPMVAGCGDTAASSLGAGLTRPGLLFDVAGTASVLACATDVFTPDTQNKTIMCAPSVLGGLYYALAYINGGGMCLKWLRDDVLEARYSYDELNEKASAIPPGSGNLFFLPHFSGRVCPNDTLVRGAFVNLSWEHGLAHMYRAILESIAYEYGVYADIIRALAPGLEFERVISVGGGSKSALFKQIKADVLGAKVSCVNLADTAALACCVIAGKGVGMYSSIESQIDASIQLRDSAVPDASLKGFYAERQAVYRSLFPALSPVYARVSKLQEPG